MPLSRFKGVKIAPQSGRPSLSGPRPGGNPGQHGAGHFRLERRAGPGSDRM